MHEKVKIFGASLDPLPSPERLNLKMAYLNHLKNQLIGNLESEDPYDFVKSRLSKNSSHQDKIKWIGKVPIPSWLTPKPKITDLPKISPSGMNQFLQENGCWDYTLKVADYVSKKINQEIPVMIGVDHSLTGGTIMALSKWYSNLNIIILDAHFDIINNVYAEDYDNQNWNNLVSSLSNRKAKSKTHLGYYECGNFLYYLLEKKVINSNNLWILGVQDEIYQKLKKGGDLKGRLPLEMIFIKEWINAGVHVIFKHEVASGDFKIDLNGPTYLSIDMDVGSMASVFSARFMNSYGLNLSEFLQTLQKVNEAIQVSHYPLVGLDVMELDIHFLGAVKEMKMKDWTDEIVKKIFSLFINKNNSNHHVGY